MMVGALVLIAMMMLFLPRLWRYQLKPYFARAELRQLLKRSPQGKEMQNSAILLGRLYHGVHSAVISRLDRRRMNLSDDSYIYGEIEFLSFMFLMEKVNPQSSEVFYDLGSGAGKPVFAAALNYDFAKAYGIEILPNVCKIANKQLQKLNEMLRGVTADNKKRYLRRAAAIQFVNGNFLDLDFSDADILFINATCLNYYTWQALLLKFSSLKPGTRIIVTSKKIDDPIFEPLYQGVELMSWGLNSVNIYRKTS